MMFWFGKEIPQEGSVWMQESSWTSLATSKKKLQQTKISDIINLLDSFSQYWTKPEIIQQVMPELIRESGFSAQEVQKTLGLLPLLLKKESLEKRINAEFTHGVLDQFTKTPGFSGRVRALPLGTILHVTAGNVFLSSIDSLIMGFLSKNISIVKVSSQNIYFPLFFARALQQFDSQNILADKFAILHWKGGETIPENFLKSKVNGIIAWGGEEMIQSYRHNLPAQVKFLDFGPKVSLQVITTEGLTGKNLKLVAQKIVDDIIPWDQSACASPQNLYLQHGIDEAALLEALDQAFTQAPAGGGLSEDEATEILKEQQRALYSQLMEQGFATRGKEHLIHKEKDKFLRPSPLHRSLIIKTFTDAADLSKHLEPFSYYLQSCSYLFSDSEKDSYLEELSFVGIKRFAPLGTITFGMEGAPHDGRYVLREMVQFIGDEGRLQELGESSEQLQTSSDIKKAFETTPHPPGYIFSSGGTTGEPKFVHFSYQEFDHATDMLAYNFKTQGIVAGMTVANLFVAGNLWSSFMAVERALEKIGAIQLPIGGMCSQENTAFYLKKFNPEIVMGIPSMLVSLAEYMESKSVRIQAKKVFYAGEALSESRMKYLSKNWQVDKFGSAGYASVDAGVIGYQCLSCGPGEHHLFSDLVKLKVVDDEAVVTSLYRTSMPIKNYRTGDRVMLMDQCSCGRTDQKFKLMGRTDNILQIWSSRIMLADIERSLNELDAEIKSFQVILSEKNALEMMSLFYEKGSKVIRDQDLISKIYHSSRDLKDTMPMESFAAKLQISALDAGLIPRNPRTGKISLVIDKR